jgi:hypothetical protein
VIRYVPWLVFVAVLVVGSYLLLRPGGEEDPEDPSADNGAQPAAAASDGSLPAPVIRSVETYDTHRDVKQYDYSPSNIIDRDWNTGWCAQYVPGGSWIRINLVTRAAVHSIALTPGFYKRNPDNPNLHYNNHRLKEIRVVFSDGDSIKHTFEDQINWQTVEFGAKACEWLRIEVLSVYETRDDPDIAIVELEVK